MTQQVDNTERKYELAESIALVKLENLVHNELGNQFGICYIDPSFIKIGVVDNDKPLKEDGTHRELFGHSFDVRMKSRLRALKEFSINYGCLGSFDPTKETSRVDFLIGLAKVASDKRVQSEIISILKEFQNAIKG